MKQVDYLIIGAGLAGMVLKRFLKNDNTVLIDPNPGGYKIGESIIPEHFRHPAIRADLPLMQKLPSYSPKWGTTFIADGEVASFPLPKEEAGVAMHVSRFEMEQAMLEAWKLDVVRERVTGVDVENKVVTTDKETYEVARQIIDCSGPAMVVARKLGMVKRLWPIYATWAYFDVKDFDISALASHIKAEGWKWRRYDASHRNVLPVEEIEGWHLARTTTLTKLGDGKWCWQIPLHGETRLSFGIVSKAGPVSKEELLETTKTHAAPGYTLEARPLDHSSHHNRVYVRNNFAVQADKPATLDYILISDAYCFADPIYSVGTGLAVNKALEVAGMLNSRDWDKAAVLEYTERYREQIARAVAGFEFWYDGKVLSDGEAASTVADNLLVGSLFQTEVAHHYGHAVADADLPPAMREQDPFDVDWNALPKTREVRALLPADGAPGWELLTVNPSLNRGLVLRWRHTEQPELSILVAPTDGGDFDVHYKNLPAGPYPASAALDNIMGFVTELTRRAPDDWKALL